MEAVSRQAQRLKKSCSKSNAEWSELSLAITELADAVEALDYEDHRYAVSEHLLPLAAQFGGLLRNLRSKLVSDTCEQLGRIVKATRLAFMPLANALLESLAGTAKASSVAIRNPGLQLFSDVSEYSRYDLQVMQRVYSSSPQERVKSLVLEQLQIVLASWPKGDIEPFYTDMLDIMRRGMRDPSSHVRTACRQTFCSFADIWQERLDELVTIPTPPARDLLMKEKPYAVITMAIRREFNIDMPNDNRGDSIRLRRSAIRRQGSSTTGDSDESIFVDVKDSSRRPSQRTATTEPSKRTPSPARGTMRSASPSSATRTSSTVRSASPSVVARGASTSRTTARSPSPSRVRRDTGAGTAPARSASPARGGNSMTTTLQDHVSASLDYRPHNNEMSRYFNSSPHEENAGNAGGPQAPKQFLSSHSQKRVSILEPPSINHHREYIQMPPNRQPFVSHDERKLSTTDYTPAIDDQLSQSPSSDARSPPKSRFAADALEFLSQARSGRFGFTGARQSEHSKSQGRKDPHLGIGSYEERSISDRSTSFHPPSSIHVDHQDASLAAVEESPIDSYLDRPIPSSSPAPEPRAEGNVTERGRRRLIDWAVDESAREQGFPEPRSFSPVASVPVPSHAVETQQIVDHSDLSCSNSEDVPPTLSIDPIFSSTTMATSTHGNASSPISDVGASNEDMYDDGDGDKENAHDGNVPKPAKTDMKIPDALANLDAIRAGVKKLRETHLGQFAGNARTSMSTLMENHGPTPPTTHESGARSTEPSQPATSHQQPLCAIAESQAHLCPGDDIRNEPLPQWRDIPSETAASPAAQNPLPAQEMRAHPFRQEHTHEESKPPVDFVREPTTFKFNLADPSLQHPGEASQNLNLVSGTTRDGMTRPPSHNPLDALKTFKGLAPPKPSAAPTRTTKALPEPDGASLHAHANHRGVSSADIDVKRAPRQDKPLLVDNGRPPHSEKQVPASTSLNGQPSAFDSPRRPVHAAVPTVPSVSTRRPAVLNPQPEKINVGVASKMIYSFCLILGTIFGISGLIQAVTKVRDAYEYHDALLNRINQFESSIVESYESVRKMDEKYVVWSEYVRELTEQDESNALHQLESIQVEVEKWQVEMKNDLVEFKRSLSGDIIDAALAHLRDPNTTSDATTPTTSVS